MNPGSIANERRAKDLYGPLLPYFRKWLANDTTYAEMAKELNRMAVLNHWGRPFSRQAVHLVVKRLRKQGHL